MLVNEKRIIKILEKYGKRLDKIEKLLESKKNEPKSREKSSSQQLKSKHMTVPAMLLLFKADKYFDEPRTLSQIAQKFREEYRNIPVTSLTLPLQKLVRNRELARVLKSGKWSYVKR